MKKNRGERGRNGEKKKKKGKRGKKGGKKEGNWSRKEEKCLKNGREKLRRWGAPPPQKWGRKQKNGQLGKKQFGLGVKARDLGENWAEKRRFGGRRKKRGG